MATYTPRLNQVRVMPGTADPVRPGNRPGNRPQPIRPSGGMQNTGPGNIGMPVHENKPAPMPSGLPSPIAPTGMHNAASGAPLGPAPTPAPATTPAPTGNVGQTYQITPQGQSGLSAMGIPAPPQFVPRPPMAPLVNPNAGGGANVPGGSAGASYVDPIQAAVNRYTGGVQHVSNPTTQGSVHNGGIGGPSQVAAVNAWQAAQNNAHYRSMFGGDPQRATNDYAPGGAMYQGPAVASAPGAAAGGGGGNPTAAPVGTSSPGAMSSGASPAASGSGNNDAQYGMLNQIAQGADAAQRESREANEQRYRDILSGRGAQYERLTDMQANLGDAERAAINRQMNSAQARNLQDATSRGLAGTTILPGMRQLTERDRTQALGQLDERLRRERIDLDRGISNDTLNFMERRDDVGPDMNQMIALAQALGNAGNPTAPVQSAYSPLNNLRGVDLSPMYIHNGLSGPYGAPMGGAYGGGGGGGGMNPVNMMLMQQLQQQMMQQAARAQQQQAASQPARTPFQRDPLRYRGINSIPSTIFRGDVNVPPDFANYV